MFLELSYFLFNAIYYFWSTIKDQAGYKKINNFWFKLCNRMIKLKIASLKKEWTPL